MTIYRNLDPSTGSVAVSCNKESTVGTAATLDRAWPDIDTGVITTVMPFYSLESNVNNLAGNREPDRFYMGNIDPFDVTLTFKECTADHAAFILAYVLGDPDAADQIGSLGSYIHVCNSFTGTVLEFPTCTMCFRRGDENQGVDKVLIYGCQGQSLSLKWGRKMKFPELSGTFQALGKHKRNILRDIVWHAADDTSLTLTHDAVEGSSAAYRLKSIHSIYCGMDGPEGRNWKELEPTVASDATPAVLTVPAPYSAVDYVYGVVSGTITSYTTGASVLLDISTTDYVMVGYRDLFNELTFTSSVVNDQAVTIDVEYFANDGSWTNVSNISDHTLTGGNTTLGQTGSIFWTLPTNWEPQLNPYSNTATLGFDRQPLYWVKIKSSAPTKATTAGALTVTYRNPAMVVFYDDSLGSYTDYTTQAKTMAGGTEFPAVQVEAADWYYIGCDTPFCQIYMEVGSTPNDAASTLTGFYYASGTWTTVGAITDGTLSVGATQAVDGAISWTQPTDHTKSDITVSSTAYSKYWVRIGHSGQLKAAAYVEGIRIAKQYYPTEVTYRALESVSFTEGDTWPSETVMSPFPISGALMYLNPQWDTTANRMHGGTPIRCELIDAEWSYNNNHPSPTLCLEGNLNRYPGRHGQGKPTQTIKINYERNRAMWDLLNAFTDENTGNTTSSTVRTLALGVRFFGPIVDPDTSTEIRYMWEICWPYVALKSLKAGTGDNRYTGTAEFMVGEDSTNSLASVYSRIINDISENYAQ